MHAQFANIGDGNGNCSKPIEVHFYLSKGYKEDPHSGDGAWKRVGTDLIQCNNLGPGTTHSEEEGLELWKNNLPPGIYNIVVCIDHPKDDHNNGGDVAEKHESNNCSTPAVFEVVQGTVNIPPLPNLMTNSFQVLQQPTYAGDQARFGGYVGNNGPGSVSTDIRTSYAIQCPSTGTIFLTDDGTKANELSSGSFVWEQTDASVTIPNVVGTCTVYFCADYFGVVAESSEADNCSLLQVTLQERPKPNLIIVRFQDKVGCCTTNLGSRIKPNIWIQNTGAVAPSGEAVVLYQISSPVGTGGAWWTIGYGGIQPSELPAGGTDEDYMDGGGWQIPKNNAWKNQWHTVRACVNRFGGSPTCGGDDSIMTYMRASKK
jgi:hypothetical protein